jgi:hypothetical protein
MKNFQIVSLKISRIIAIVAIIIAIPFFNVSVFAQHDHTKNTKVGKNVIKTESIVRQGMIDLKKMDKNKDGKVYQDQMHWNVISDEAGKCPLCKMTLVEVSLKTAKDNLKKNEFKVR